MLLYIKKGPPSAPYYFPPGTTNAPVYAEQLYFFLDTELLEKYGVDTDAFMQYAVKSNADKLSQTFTGTAEYVCIGTVGTDRIVCSEDLYLKRVSEAEYTVLQQEGKIGYTYDCHFDDSKLGWGLEAPEVTKKFLRDLRTFVTKLAVLGVAREEYRGKIVEYIQRYIKKSGKTYDELIGWRSYYFDVDYKLQEATCNTSFCDDGNIALLGTDCEYIYCVNRFAADGSLLTNVFVTSKLRAVFGDTSYDFRRVLYADDAVRLATVFGAKGSIIAGLTECELDLAGKIKRFKSGRPQISYGDCLLEDEYSGNSDVPIWEQAIVGVFGKLKLRHLTIKNVSGFTSDRYFVIGNTASEYANEGNKRGTLLRADNIEADVCEITQSSLIPPIKANILVLSDLYDVLFLVAASKYKNIKVLEAKDGTGVISTVMESVLEVILSGPSYEYSVENFDDIWYVLQRRNKGLKITIHDVELQKRWEAYLQEHKEAK